MLRRKTKRTSSSPSRKRQISHGGFSPSPDRQPSLPVDPELDRELTSKILEGEKETVEALLDSPATLSRVKEQIKKAYDEALNSPDLYRELTLLLQKETEKIKLYVLEETRDVGQKLEEIDLEYRKKLAEKSRQEETLKQLERDIKEQRRQYYELLGIPDPEVVAEQERLKKEKEEQEQREKELQQQLAQQAEEEMRLKEKEEERRKAEEKRQQMANFTFTAFGAIPN